MSETSGRPPNEFKPIEDPKDVRSLLRDGARNLASSMIWTKDQTQVVQTHMNLFSTGEDAIYFAKPKEVEREAFLGELQKTGDKYAFFSVSLTRANIFFKAKLLELDAAGFKFKVPEKIFTVQRRRDVRLPIPRDYTLKVEFDDPLVSDKTMLKKIIDVSATGMGFLVSNDEVISFQPGIIVNNLTFTLRDRKITVNAEVRHTREYKGRTRASSGHKVGVQFVGIRPGESQHIASYVFEETRKYYTRFL